jgi:hypothetical protein
VYAVDLKLDGYYRLRGNVFGQLDLNSDNFSSTRKFWDQRFRLDPYLTVNDYILVRSTIDILDNTIFGADPLNSEIGNNPNFFQTSSSGNTTTPVIYEDPQTSTFAFSGGQSSSIVNAKRVWAEITTSYGIFRAGRQPSHFGLGIAENNGNGLFDNFGDTEDRISFTTGYKGFVLGSGIDKEAEIDSSLQQQNIESEIDNQEDDVTRIFIESGYEKNDFKFNSLISTRRQGESNLKAWFFDFYLDYKWDFLSFEGEFLNAQGGYQNRNITAYNWVTRILGEKSRFKFGGETGFSSGTQGGATNTTDLNTIPFDKDYNISFLLFEEALPGGSGKDSLDTTNTNIESTPRYSGAISNTVYWRLFGSVRFFKKLEFGLNVLNAWALKDPIIGYDTTSALSFASNSQYGTEYNINISYDVFKELKYTFTFAQFFPGGVYDDQQRLLFNDDHAESAYVFNTGIYINW